MIHIAKSKTGFLVATLSGNGEVLSVSEVLSSKQKCWQNIRSQMIQWDTATIGVGVQDDTLKGDSKVYVFWRSGKQVKKILNTVYGSNPKYIPADMKPKPKKK